MRVYALAIYKINLGMRIKKKEAQTSALAFVFVIAYANDGSPPQT